MWLRIGLISAPSHQWYSFSDEGIDVSVGPMTEDSSHEWALPSEPLPKVAADSGSGLEEDECMAVLMSFLEDDSEGIDMMSTSSEGAPTSPGSCASSHTATAQEGTLRCRSGVLESTCR